MATLVIPLIIIVSGCLPNGSKDINNDKGKSKDKDVKVAYIHQNDEQFKALKDKGAKIAKVTQVTLGKALNSAITEGGHEYAIDFCNEKALSITDSVSDSEQVSIRRIAKKYRNPQNATDDIESKIFKQYIMEYLSGAPLKAKLAINQNGNPVYYKPIITNSMCLSCHGTPGETMTFDIAETIREKYPADKAINFKAGHPRGMWAITFEGINVATSRQ